MNSSLMRSRFRRLIAGPSFNTIVDQASFRYAAECERLRIYRNDSTLAVLLLRLADPNDESRDAVAEVLERHLSPIDTAGYCFDGRIGILLPDFNHQDAQILASQIETDCDDRDCQVRIEQIDYPDRSLDVVIGDGDDSAATEEETTAGAFFAVPVPFWKRAIDVTVASLALLLSSPVILTGVALVKLSSHGTAFYAQERIGQGGRPFMIHKIRTMQMGADKLVDGLRHQSDQDGPAFKMKKDPRILPIGKLLRKLSIDELPQLWNVIKGEMSLVGPRPLPSSEAKQLTLWQQERMDTLPGITGPWQISGRNKISFDQWMRMDIEYTRNHSVLSDLKILLLTIPAVVMCRGAS